LTSGENGYSLDVDKFIQSMKKFGVLSPFPYYIQKARPAENARAMPSSPYRIQILEDASPKVPGNKNQILPPTPENAPSPLKNRKTTNIPAKSLDKPTEQESPTEGAGLDNFLRLDSTSALFAQHYSLLRELKSYTSEFRMLIKNEAEISEVWKCFESLSTVLENGCQFLSFPMQI
jgi:hypothetical protein